MKAMGITTLLLAGILAAGCGWPSTDEERADWFFEHGEEWVLEALEDVNADEAQRDAASAVFARHEADVKAAVEAYIGQHRELLRTLASGAATPELLEQQASLTEEHREALRRVGALHEDLEAAVGDDTWTASRARMRERIEERMEDG